MTSVTADVSVQLRDGLAPCAILPREGTDPWLVRLLPLDEGVGPEGAWSQVDSGEFVRVPLVPYRTWAPDAEKALALAFQLGILGLAAADRLVPVELVQEVLVVAGRPVEEVLQDGCPVGYRFWLGFAFRHSR